MPRVLVDVLKCTHFFLSGEQGSQKRRHLPRSSSDVSSRCRMLPRVLWKVPIRKMS